MHKVSVIGASGMVGSAVVKALEGYEVDAPTHHDWDFTSQKDAETYFEIYRDIDTVILCAGKVGGIKANMEDPYGFLYENAMIGLNTIHAAKKFGIKYLINLSSSCVYPRLCKQPMKEEYMMTGSVEPTNEGYAFGKQVALKMAEYAGYVSLIPCNIYGENDDWSENGHVMAALVRRLCETKENLDQKFVMRGSGTARREFLHSQDLAEAIVHVMKMIHDGEDVPLTMNVGSGVDYSIREMVTMIMKSVDYYPELDYDLSFPDGMPQKLTDVSKINNLGWESKIDIEQGIEFMVKEYENNKLLG